MKQTEANLLPPVHSKRRVVRVVVFEFSGSKEDIDRALDLAADELRNLKYWKLDPTYRALSPSAFERMDAAEREVQSGSGRHDMGR